MQVPERWRSYPCDDYFASTLAVEGLWDESSQLWLIEPAERIEEEADAEFLQIGRPGVDNIGFGYRKGYSGFWAFRRIIEPGFQYLAPSVQDFLNEWFAGHIIV